MSSLRMLIARNRQHALRQMNILQKTESCVFRSISSPWRDTNLHMCQMLKHSQTHRPTPSCWWSRGEDGWMARFLEQRKSLATASIWSTVKELVTDLFKNPSYPSSWFTWQHSTLFSSSSLELCLQLSMLSSTPSSSPCSRTIPNFTRPSKMDCSLRYSLTSTYSC